MIIKIDKKINSELNIKEIGNYIEKFLYNKTGDDTQVIILNYIYLKKEIISEKEIDSKSEY
jgi:hypothetical protein